METLGEGENEASLNTLWHQLPVEEDPSQFLGQTSGSLEADSLQGITLNSDGQMADVEDQSVQPDAERFESLQLELQDSCLSPALSLIPQGKEVYSESTLLHQTDLEFFPLRGSPDLSIASESCPQMVRLDVHRKFNQTHTSQEQESLLQQNVGTMSAILEDASSCLSLSQHSLSPNSNYQATQVHGEENISGLENNNGRKKQGKLGINADLDGKWPLRSGIPVCSFQNCLENDIGEDTSNTLSSSEAVLSQTDAVLRLSDTHESQESQFKPSEVLAQPQSSSSTITTMGRGRPSLSHRLSAISNITVRSTNKQIDENINTPVGQNVHVAAERASHTAGPQRALWSVGSNQASDGSFLTSQPVFQSTPAVLLARGVPAAAIRLPVYSHQETVATSPQKSSPKPVNVPSLAVNTTHYHCNAEVTIATSGEIHTELDFQREIPHSQEALTPLLDVPVIAKDTSLDQPTLPVSDQQLKDQEPRLSKGSVNSLPSLNYVEKVDAWKANQSSSSLFYDNLSSNHDNGVHTKNKTNDLVSEAIKQHSTTTSNSNTQTGNGVLSGMDVEVVGGAIGSTSPSTFIQSYSQSSLGTVVTPIQPDELQRNQPSLINTDDFSPSSTEAKSLPSSNVINNQRSADVSRTSHSKTPVSSSMDQYSCINPNTNKSNMVSSLQASVGAASSVVSLEIDNYAPYWTSRPESPRRPYEFNIEDRIPLYLHNLGIHQSPSTILNPFTHRGPIREPEFSPTDLCTIKGSVGTPTKSIQPFDGDSLQQETVSCSSVLSADSSASLTQLIVQRSVQQPARPASLDSRRMADIQTETLPEPERPSDNVPQRADTSLREGSYGLSTEVSLKSTAGTSERFKAGDLSLVGSGTLQEIRRLLGHAESHVSARYPRASFSESHCRSESDASFLSLRQNTQMYHDDSFLSVDEKISLVLARSSSDSALKESSSSSSGLLELSRVSDLMNKEPIAPSVGREKNPKSRDFCVAPRRAEPEGCSAADPDTIGPASMSVTQGNAPLTADGQQQSQNHTKMTGPSSSTTSPTHSQTEAEMCVLSDASSEHSLASRVAKLLQSESSASVVTSQSSSAEPDETRAKEWIVMKVSGAKCEALELNSEDRRRIEEIKSELLLHTKYTKSSSDSESGTQSSICTVPRPAVGFTAARSADDRLSEKLQNVSQIPLDSSVPLQALQEDGVSQTATKEGRNPQTVGQCLHTHNSHVKHNDIALESNSHTTVKSSVDLKSQAQMACNKTNNEVEKEKVARTDVHTVREISRCADSERNVPLPIPEAAHCEKREFPSGLESSSALGQKPVFSTIHLTPSTPHSNSCSYTEMLTGSHVRYSDSLNTSIEVLLPVSSTNKEQQTPVSTETAENGNADQIQHTGTVNGYAQMTSRHPQLINPSQRLAGPSRPLLLNAAAIPTLLPYKPHGSSKLFYMPKTVPEYSLNCSDTTVESSHPGSDDAVPPQFAPEVLGSRELVDNRVTPKHKEGIYSKRAKMRREVTITEKGLHDQRGNTGLPYQHSRSAVSVSEQVAEQTKEREAFTPLHMEADYSTAELPSNHREQKQSVEMLNVSSHPKAAREKEQDMTAHNIGTEIGSSLDQLWHRFNDRYSLQESRTINDPEKSLLERLERLSRLLHSTSPAHNKVEKGKSRTEHGLKRTWETDASRKGTEKGRNEAKGLVILKPKTAWGKESFSTRQTLPEREPQKQDYRCPAEKDESASASLETSSSRSTIDTQRLIRAFGPHRVSRGREEVTGGQTLKLSDGLLKRHNIFTKKKRGHGQANSENRLVSVATETSNTDDSVASDTLSSSSTYTVPTQRATGRNARCKRAQVKLVSRSIQAGDLEIVVNGTRKDTRDVGTTFPSPGSPRGNGASSAVCSKETTSMSTLRSSSATPVQSQPVLRKQAHTKHTCYQNGLSWFVSADELKWGARKENNPQTDAGQAEGRAWFEPYTRTQPWREPLRERNLQIEIQKPQVPKTHSANDSHSKHSALVRLSLQEALELHRPEFVSHSRERMKRLCLLVEERKMQAVFNKEREELFNRPTAAQPSKAAPAPPPPPAKRIIPPNEMIRRSKRIYAKLPEVQKRKEEERRKAEYHSYRLNAQLFNKKITNRLLGRRTPWQ